MVWLLEKPLFIVVIGMSTTGILGGIWLQTGRRVAIHAMLATLALTCLLLGLERWIETDREQIDATLHRIARHVERNDLDAVLTYAHSDAEWIRQQASNELPRYVFQQVKIKANLEIQVASEASPKEAVAEFNAVVVLSDRSGLFQNNRVPRYVIVKFQKEGEDWRVTDYEHHDARFGYTQREPQRSLAPAP